MQQQQFQPVAPPGTVQAGPSVNIMEEVKQVADPRIAARAANWSDGMKMDLGETWVETKSGDGMSYFFHAMTRESTWIKPEGPNIEIMTQQQYEQVAAIVNQGTFLWTNFTVKKISDLYLHVI